VEEGVYVKEVGKKMGMSGEERKENKKSVGYGKA